MNAIEIGLTSHLLLRKINWEVLGFERYRDQIDGKNMI